QVVRSPLTYRSNQPVHLRIHACGAGAYPDSPSASVYGERVDASYVYGRVLVSTAGLAPGRHRLQLRVSDFQETRNTENVARILPNTRFFSASITIRGR